MKIIVTGGHLTPATAVLSQLRKIKPKISFYFFGRKNAVEGDSTYSFEYLTVKKLGIPFFDIPAGRLQRRFTRYWLNSMVKVIPGFLKSLVLLAKIRPNVVLTFGGYLAVPSAAAAVVLRIPVVAHEQSPNLGLANKIIFKLAKLKGVSNSKLLEKLSNTNVFYTGPLLREEIFKVQPQSTNLAKFLQNFKNDPFNSIQGHPERSRMDEKLIYVTGGTTGSHFLNELVGKILRKILPDYFIIHQTGNLHQSLDFKNLLQFKRSLLLKLQEKYFLTEFVDSHDLGGILSCSNLIICRSGANTTSELQAVAKPAIVIPLVWGAEQTEIAKELEKTGSFIILLQEEATENKLLASIGSIFANYEKFKKQAKLQQKEINVLGAKLFARKILELDA